MPSIETVDVRPLAGIVRTLGVDLPPLIPDHANDTEEELHTNFISDFMAFFDRIDGLPNVSLEVGEFSMSLAIEEWTVEVPSTVRRQPSEHYNLSIFFPIVTAFQGSRGRAVGHFMFEAVRALGQSSQSIREQVDTIMFDAGISFAEADCLGEYPLLNALGIHKAAPGTWSTVELETKHTTRPGCPTPDARRGFGTGLEVVRRANPADFR